MSSSATSSKRSAATEWLLRRADVVAAILFFVTALIWSQTIPLFEAPDEHSHYRYAEFVAEHGRLPAAGDIANLWEGFQPPLYYVLLAALIRADICEPGVVAVENPEFSRTRPDADLNEFDANAIRAANSPDVVRGAYRLRVLNAVFGALFVWLCFKLVKSASAERFGFPMVVLWVFAPAVVFSAATMSNDLLAALFCVAALYQYQLHRIQGRLRSVVMAGVFFGLGMMTKSTALFLWLSLLAVDLLRTPRFQINLKRTLLVVIPLLIAGAPVVRSLSLHPMMSPDPHRLAWMNQSVLWYLLSWPLTLIKSLYWSAFTSVGVLGSQALWLPGWTYGAYFGLLLVFLWVAQRGFRERAQRFLTLERDPEFVASFLATILLLALSVVRFRESGETMHARLLFGYFPGLLLGVSTLAGRVSLDIKSRSSRARIALAALVTVIATFAVFLPTDAYLGAAGIVKSYLKAGKDAAYYAAILQKGLTATLICVAIGSLAPTIFHWLARPVQNANGRVVLLACCGLAFNLCLLFLFVLPKLAS